MAKGLKYLWDMLLYGVRTTKALIKAKNLTAKQLKKFTDLIRNKEFRTALVEKLSKITGRKVTLKQAIAYAKAHPVKAAYLVADKVATAALVLDYTIGDGQENEVVDVDVDVDAAKDEFDEIVKSLGQIDPKIKEKLETSQNELLGNKPILVNYSDRDDEKAVTRAEVSEHSEECAQLFPAVKREAVYTSEDTLHVLSMTATEKFEKALKQNPTYTDDELLEDFLQRFSSQSEALTWLKGLKLALAKETIYKNQE